MTWKEENLVLGENEKCRYDAENMKTTLASLFSVFQLEIKVHKNEVLLIKWELNTFVHGGSKSRWK